MNKFKGLLFSLMSLIVLLVGCESSESTTESVSDKVKIVTTLFPQYDFARVIGGDKVDVKLLLPAGMESHSYEPTPADIIEINNYSEIDIQGIFTHFSVADNISDNYTQEQFKKFINSFIPQKILI